jgi:predicted TIM-barrel fold metal-dependent hydrolase
MSLFHHGHPHPSFYPRRNFMRKSFVFLGTLANAAKASKWAKASEWGGRIAGQGVKAHPFQALKLNGSTDSAPKGVPATRFRIFDAHLHCPSDESSGEIWQWYPVTKTFAEFAAYLEKTGVQRGIINAQRCNTAKSAADFIAGNREVARYVEKYKGRFIGACVVNPLFIDESLKEIEYCRKQLGFVWVGELCNYVVPYKYTINEFELLVEQVAKLNMVLDVHTDVEEMHGIIQKFPRATIVFPHFGGDSEIFRRIELVAAHRNTFLDTSGYGIDRVGMLEYAVKTVGEDRILFGSDFSINCPATVTGRVRSAFLTDQQKQKIFAENLEALLKRVSS